MKIVKPKDMLSNDSSISDRDEPGTTGKRLKKDILSFRNNKQYSVPNFKLQSNVGKGDEKNKEVPEFKITLTKEKTSKKSKFFGDNSVSKDSSINTSRAILPSRMSDYNEKSMPLKQPTLTITKIDKHTRNHEKAESVSENTSNLKVRSKP